MYITYLTHATHDQTLNNIVQNYHNQQFWDRQDFKGRAFTKEVELTPENKEQYNRKYPIAQWASSIHNLLQIPPFPQKTDMSEFYTTFQIPKHSGGFRTIEAPNDILKDYQRQIKEVIDSTHWLADNAAFAYVSGRSTKAAVAQHIESNWFLKLDIHHFFPSCNLELLKMSIGTVFPFCLMEEQIPFLDEMIKWALVNDHLPQGTPLSPLLTNIMMVPFDTEIRKHIPKEMVYTRYADDILLSSKFKFDWRQIQDKVKEILDSYSLGRLELNTDKTRFGSVAGRNWNLGIMLNKDHKMTIGHAKKERIRAAIFNFMRDLTEGNSWSTIDVQVLAGQIAYAKNIEPDYFEHTIQSYEQKFHKNLQQEIKNCLRTPD